MDSIALVYPSLEITQYIVYNKNKNDNRNPLYR